MREYLGRCSVAGMLQFGWPEQRMEVENVLADEVIELGGGICFEIFVEVEAVLAAQVFERAHVADRCIEPDIKVLARCVGDFKAEIGGVARNIPVGQFVFTRCAQPFLHLVGGFVLQNAVVTAGVLAQERFAARI
jgi:hypothetical protein